MGKKKRRAVCQTVPLSKTPTSQPGDPGSAHNAGLPMQGDVTAVVPHGIAAEPDPRLALGLGLSMQGDGVTSETLAQESPPDPNLTLGAGMQVRNGALTMVPLGPAAIPVATSSYETASVAAVQTRDVRFPAVCGTPVAAMQSASVEPTRHISHRLRRRLDNLINAFEEYYDNALGQPQVADNPPLYQALIRALDGLESLPRGADGLVVVHRSLEPQQQVVTRYLNGILDSVACSTPQTGVFLALRDFARHMQWTQGSHESYWDTQPSSGFKCGYAWGFIVGPGAFVESARVGVGFYLQAPGVLYPPHHHPSGELYGRGPDGSAPVWRQSGKAPTAQRPGAFVWHPPYATHYMDTRATGPMLNTFAWLPNTSSHDLICESMATDKGWSLDSVYAIGGGDDDSMIG